MFSRGKVLVIECLGVASWLYAVVMRWRFAHAYYVSEAWLLRRLGVAPAMARVARLTRLRFEDFPGSYYDIQREAAVNANDAFHNVHGLKHPFVGLLLAYQNDHLLDIALRKGLLVYYTMPRVKAWVFLEALRRQYEHLVFVPRDNLPFGRYLSAPWQSAAHGCRVPLPARALNALREILARLMVPAAVLLLVLALPVRRGIRRGPSVPRIWPLAFDMYDSGIAWDRRHTDEILYDGADFAPQRVLHVFRDRLADEATRAHFEATGCPYVEFGRVALPAKLFFHRMLGRAVGETMRWLPLILFRTYPADNYLVPFLAVLRSTMEHEALFAWHRIGVFVARDEYRLQSVVRTALMHAHGGKTVGFSHGDDSYLGGSCQYIAMDYFCYVGDFHKNMLHAGNAETGEAVVIGAGVYGLDETFRIMQSGQIPQKYAHLMEGYRLVGAFPTSWGIDFSITHEQLVNFYRVLLTLEETYDDIYILVRPKNHETGLAVPEIRNLLSRSKGRIVVEEQLSAYELIPLCDLMICMAFTTVGLEGIVAGKRVLYFDQSGLRENPYRRHDPRLVAWTPDEMYRNVKWVLDEGDYVDREILESIRSYHGRCFDGKVRERLHQVVRKALRETLSVSTSAGGSETGTSQSVSRVSRREPAGTVAGRPAPTEGSVR